jgi:hypothetical protein
MMRVNKLPPSSFRSGVLYISSLHYYMAGSRLLESFLAFGRGQAMYTAAYSLTPEAHGTRHRQRPRPPTEPTAILSHVSLLT